METLIAPQRAIIVPMDITKMLEELREEREGVEQAIMVLERTAVRASRGPLANAVASGNSVFQPTQNCF